jgi:hypothetical protein
MARREDAARQARDPISDTLPLVLSATAAWWTTVRAGSFGPTATWITRVPALVALVGIAFGALAIVRGSRRYVWIVLGGFVVPSAAAWLLSPDPASNALAGTALLEPIELFLGALAWTTLGLVLMRPHAVVVPRGAQGGRGPTIGAGDDVSRIAMREVEAELRPEEPTMRLLPRHVLPRLAVLPLWAAIALTAVAAYQLVRVATPDRAILARLAAAAIAIALFGTASDLVEVRYLARARPTSSTRLSRAGVTLAVVVLLAVVGFVLIGRDPGP